MYLEQWLHRILRAGFKPEGEITRADIDSYHLFRLKDTIQYACGNSSFYRELYRSAGIEPAAITCLEDLQRLPFTEPDQLAASPYRFLCVPLSDVERPCSFVTSGTTGPQKKVFWSVGDLDRIIDFMAAGIGTVAGIEDAVHVMLPDGRPFSQADLLARGVRRLGGTASIGRMDADAEEQLRIITDTRSTIVFGYTGALFRMSRELAARRDLRTAGVNCLFLAGGYVPEAMRKELEAIWDCRVRTHYGLTEMGLGVAVECQAEDGYHFNEADLLVEVIHPQTGERVAAGEEGELVFTTLTREAMPLVRYRTRDISRLIEGHCMCGAATLLKFGHVRKRIGSSVRLAGGDEIYPASFDDLLFAIDGVLDYQVALTRAERDQDCLEFRIEMMGGSRADAIFDIQKRLVSAPLVSRGIANGTMAPPEVRLLESGALLRTDRAKKLILDQR